MFNHLKRAAVCALVIFGASLATLGCVPDDDCSVTATCPPPAEPDAGDAKAADASVASELSDVSADRSHLPDDALAGDSLVLTTTDGSSIIDTSTGDEGLALPDGSSSDPASCMSGMKRCGSQCVAIDDATYGCGATTCDKSKCPNPGTGTLVCQSGTCVLGSCSDATKKCGAACVGIDNAAYGCGVTSCTPCPAVAGATLTCQAGACAIATCAAGTKKCGDSCVSVNDVNYGCGATTCDMSSCPAISGGTLSCQAGACVIATCAAGQKKCGGKCVAIDDPTYGCGATTCDATTCPAPGAGTLVCSAGTCAIGSCGAGTKKCGTKCVPTDVNNGCAETTSCAACASNESCVGSPSQCQCIPNVDACTGKNCGSVVNNCGQTISCGTCTAPQTCKGGGVTNKCGCTPINPCSGGKCGKGLSDACGGTVDCGCSGTNTCGGGGTAGACGCTKKTCTGLCGSQSDGCGGTMQCPACCAPKTTCAASDCGTVSNGCGGTLNCRACCANLTCGTTCCSAPPSNGKMTCTNNACTPFCNDGEPLCGGTSCCSTPPPNATACNGGQCSVKFANELTCSGGAKVPGHWDFESKTAEGWAHVPQVDSDRTSDAWNSIFGASGNHASSGSFALAIGHNNPIPVFAYSVMGIDLCPAGQTVGVSRFSLQIYADPTVVGGTLPFDLGWVSEVDGLNGTTVVGDWSLVTSPQGDLPTRQWVQISRSLGDSLPMTRLQIVFNTYGIQWAGVVYYDDIRVN